MYHTVYVCIYVYVPACTYAVVRMILNVPLPFHLFGNHSIFQLASAVVSGVYEPIPSVYTPNLSLLISKLLTVDMKARPEAR